MKKKESGETGLRSNTLWALGADGVQILLTMTSFFLLAGFLGKNQFGVYAAAMSLSALAAFVGYLGAQQLLMLDHAAGQPFPELWDRLVSTVFAGGFAVTFVLTVAQPLILPELERTAFAAIALSQVVFFGLSEFGLVAAQAHRQMSATFAIRVTSGSIRLLTVVAFVRYGEPVVATWAWFALVAWTVAALCALGWVRLFFGPWPRWSPPDRTAIRRGLPFVFGASSATILADADRLLLIRLDDQTGADASGLYAVGYRLASLAFLPVNALVRASDYDFYTAGAIDQQKAKTLAVRLTSMAAGYGLFAAVALMVSAPFVVDILGSDYADTDEVIRYLAPLSLIKACQIFPANALTATNQQHLRNRALFLAVAINLGANAVLIPDHSWRGAIAATLAAEVAMAFALWLLLLRSLHSPEVASGGQDSPR